MNAFRRWLWNAIPVVVLLATATALFLVVDRRDFAETGWLLWIVSLVPLFGARSRPCRRPRWLGGARPPG